MFFFSNETALPWTPKVRPKDLDQFLDTTRLKFVGFMLPNDRVSLAGLPQPIHEGVRVLKEVYSRTFSLKLEQNRTENRTHFMFIITAHVPFVDRDTNSTRRRY